MTRYITAAQADQLRRDTLAYFDAAALGPFDKLRLSGRIDLITTDYYIVPDDDPRLLNQTPDPLAGA